MSCSADCAEASTTAKSTANSARVIVRMRKISKHDFASCSSASVCEGAIPRPKAVHMNVGFDGCAVCGGGICEDRREIRHCDRGKLPRYESGTRLPKQFW